MILKIVPVGSMQVNCYILASGKGGQAIIIDPGAQERRIRKALAEDDLKPGFVVNTHGHYDHIGCDNVFGVPVYVHQDDAMLLKDAKQNLSAIFDAPVTVAAEIRPVKEGDSVALDGIRLKIVHLPGHTPGGMALQVVEPDEKIVFTGDALFFHSIGRADLPGGDESLLIRNIKEKILILPDETVVHPGHGQSTTVQEEKKNNPFLQ